MTDPHLARIVVHPIKSLSAHAIESTRVTAGGGLVGDREYAMVDDRGVLNGSRTAAVHDIRAAYDRDDDGTTVVTLRHTGGDHDVETYHLPEETDAAADWLSDVLDRELWLERDTESDLLDRSAPAGPTVVATASLRAVASWYDDADHDVDLGSVRRRFRTNLEVGGVDAFWEDRLYREGGRRVRVGDLELRGEGICTRCAVPTRDPDTGNETRGFRERFLDERETTLPGWAPRDAFDTHYKLAVYTSTASDAGTEASVGDPVSVSSAPDAV